MKKFLAMLVAAMMVLSLVAIPVLADGEVVFAVENAPATATPGDEITVNLTVNGTFEAHVLNMQFNYNADAFEYVSHTRGDVLNQIIDLGGTQLVDATTIPGSMRLGVMMPTAAFTQSGTICSVTLRVKEGAANGASDLALVITEFKNFPTGGQATPIANVVNNATVTITGGSEPTPVPPTEEPTPTQNPNTPAPGGMATISLTAGDVFGDGSGYQMLLDADATAYGNEIPVEGPLTQSGNAPAGLYDAFEYKIPVNADGSTTTSNVVVNNTVTIQVPAGTYDWCLTNPTPGDRIWIASSQGNVGGRADDYEFVAGNTYNFTVYLLGQNDATDVEIIGGGTPSTPVPPTQNPVTPEPGTTTGWGFETDPFAEGWTIRDDDGDSLRRCGKTAGTSAGRTTTCSAASAARRTCSNAAGSCCATPARTACARSSSMSGTRRPGATPCARSTTMPWTTCAISSRRCWLRSARPWPRVRPSGGRRCWRIVGAGQSRVGTFDS